MTLEEIKKTFRITCFILNKIYTKTQKFDIIVADKFYEQNIYLSND